MSDQKKAIFNLLDRKTVFNRTDVFNILKSEHGQTTMARANNEIQRMFREGSIIRVGNNKYMVAEGIGNYHYDYSDSSEAVSEILKKKHPLLDFRIFELIQLNEFLNHLVAHNVIFLSVERDIGAFVFSTLKNIRPGKVLLYPDKNTYHNYVSDDTIVISNLITEAPRGITLKWHTRPEKLLVDLFADKCLKEAVNEGEYRNIFEGVFEKYAVDEQMMFRYAKRRNAAGKVADFILKETNIKLRTIKNDHQRKFQ